MNLLILIIATWASLNISAWIYFYYISTHGEDNVVNLEPDITFVPPPPASDDDGGD